VVNNLSNPPLSGRHQKAQAEVNTFISTPAFNPFHQEFVDFLGNPSANSTLKASNPLDSLAKGYLDQVTSSALDLVPASAGKQSGKWMRYCLTYKRLVPAFRIYLHLWVAYPFTTKIFDWHLLVSFRILLLHPFPPNLPVRAASSTVVPALLLSQVVHLLPHFP
jgi:hypothetical protein